MNRAHVLSVLAVAGLANVALAQDGPWLQCIGRTDLFDIVVAQINNQPNPNRIGTNPCAVAINGDTIYVAGFNNSGSTMPGRVIKIDNAIAGPVTFTPIPAAEWSMPAFFGFTGMSYRAGSGLLIAFDNYASNPDGQLRLFDVDSGPTPTLLASSPAGLQGSCGPAWDNGYDGTGYDYPSGAGTARGALPATMLFGQVGPFGLSPLTLDINIGQTVYEYNPPSWNVRLDFTGISGTTWRDLDINPNNGTMAARANNDLVIGKRANDNANFSKQTMVDGGNAPFQAGQNVAIMSNFPGADLVIYNSRATGAGGQPFTDVVKVVDNEGNPIAMKFSNTAALDGFLADGNAWYDFSWDPATKRLVILDFADYYAYVFIPCPADTNGDGVVDLVDFFQFFNDFDASNDGANVDGNAGVDLGDFFAFFNAFDTSCL